MKKQTKAKADNEPMDPSIRETGENAPIVFTKRTAYAVETLIAEVEALFPDVVYEVTDYNGRNVGLGVQFVDQDGLGELLFLLADTALTEDGRVMDVLQDDEYASVLMYSNPRTQDSREPFGLAEAKSVLDGDLL